MIKITRRDVTLYSNVYDNHAYNTLFIRDPQK